MSHQQDQVMLEYQEKVKKIHNDLKEKLRLLEELKLNIDFASTKPPLPEGVEAVYFSETRLDQLKQDLVVWEEHARRAAELKVFFEESKGLIEQFQTHLRSITVEINEDDIKRAEDDKEYFTKVVDKYNLEDIASLTPSKIPTVNDELLDVLRIKDKKSGELRLLNAAEKEIWAEGFKAQNSKWFYQKYTDDDHEKMDAARKLLSESYTSTRIFLADGIGKAKGLEYKEQLRKVELLLPALKNGKDAAEECTEVVLKQVASCNAERSEIQTKMTKEAQLRAAQSPTGTSKASTENAARENVKTAASNSENINDPTLERVATKKSRWDSLIKTMRAAIDDLFAFCKSLKPNIGLPLLKGLSSASEKKSRKSPIEIPLQDNPTFEPNAGPERLEQHTWQKTSPKAQ